jgi:hypothetical protein
VEQRLAARLVIVHASIHDPKLKQLACNFLQPFALRQHVAQGLDVLCG